MHCGKVCLKLFAPGIAQVQAHAVVTFQVQLLISVEVSASGISVDGAILASISELCFPKAIIVVDDEVSGSVEFS